MSSETKRIDPGGTVYPTAGNGGITRRDWLAGQFMAAKLARFGDGMTPEENAAWSYKYADALIAEGNRDG